MASQMLRLVRMPGKLVWRFVSGAHLHGEKRTDAGWFTYGTRALPPESRTQPADSVTAEVSSDMRAVRTEWRELRVRRALGRWFRDVEREIVDENHGER
jgi:hypothetical protein